MNGSYDKKRDYIRYRCREAMKSRACGDPRCVDRSYNGAKIEGFVLDGLRDVVRRPVLIENALQACKAETASVSQNWADTKGRIKNQLAKTTAKERHTVESQIEAKQVGGSTDIYLLMLKELAQQKLQLTAQLQEAESMQLSQVNETVAVTIAEVLACVDEALSSPEVTDGERHDLLARVVQEVVPVEDGCRMRLTKFPGMETVNNVFTIWNSREDFLNWVRSDAFTKGHAQSGTLPKDAYPKPNVLEMHEVVSDSSRPDMPPEPHGGPFKMHQSRCTNQDAPIKMHQSRCTNQDAPIKMHQSRCTNQDALIADGTKGHTDHAPGSSFSACAYADSRNYVRLRSAADCRCVCSAGRRRQRPGQRRHDPADAGNSGP